MFGFQPRSAELNRFKHARKHSPADASRLILVADDDDLMREMCTVALTDCGYQVDTANDGNMAWEALCTRQYDLLIVDHSMPSMTGLSLIGRIRAVPSQLPVILMSGANARVTGEPIEVIDPRFFLAKPMQLSAFLAMVKEVLK